MTRARVATGIVLALFVLLGATSVAAQEDRSAGDFAVTFHYPLIKRPLSPENRSAAIAATAYDPENPVVIRLAGGEYELAVIGIHATAGDATDTPSPSVPLAELIVDRRTLPEGFRVNVYYLPPFVVERKSRWFDRRDVTGAWFDPCVSLPMRATERTIEFDLSAIGPPGAESRYLLLEVWAPRSAPGPGAFPLRLYVQSVGGGTRPVPPLVVQPFGFDLPAYHTLPVLMGIEGDDVLEQHRLHGLLPDDEEPLWLDYLTILREHRIVPYNPLLAEDFSREDFEVTALPLYHGELTPDGVPAPAIRFPENPYDQGTPERVDFFRSVAARLREEGLLERAFYYVDDEPLIDDYTELIADAAEIREVVPDLRTLVTEPYTPRLAGLIDIWSPDIPMFNPGVPLWPLYGKGSGLQPEFQVNHDIGVYDSERAAGRELWMYTCTSAQMLDYPSLFIDAPPAAHRIIPWMLDSFDASGFLYFRMTQAYRDGNDPWDNQYYFAANGDGTLLYPGHPDLPWVSEHRAVASLRMKILRDGLEDYEYLRIAADRGIAPALSVDDVVGSAREWEDDLGEIAAVRSTLGAIIDGSADAPPRPIRFNQVSQPSVTLDYWYLPKWAAPERETSGFGVLSYRHLLASALDTGHRTANVATRGRWQVYLQAGAAAGLVGDALDFGGYSAVGGTVSLETAEALNRTWLIPYVGMEGGVLTGSQQRDTFTAFSGSVLAGIHIWSTPRTTLAIGGAWTHTTAAEVPVAFRGVLAFDFVIGR